MDKEFSDDEINEGKEAIRRVYAIGTQSTDQLEGALSKWFDDKSSDDIDKLYRDLCAGSAEAFDGAFVSICVQIQLIAELQRRLRDGLNELREM